MINKKVVGARPPPVITWWKDGRQLRGNVTAHVRRTCDCFIANLVEKTFIDLLLLHCKRCRSCLKFFFGIIYQLVSISFLLMY